MSSLGKEKLFGGKRLAALMLGPALGLFVLFKLWPAVDSLYVSLCSWTGFSPEAEYVGLENYRNLMHDNRFWSGLWNTFLYAVAGGIGHFAFAYLFAAALKDRKSTRLNSSHRL